MKKRFVIETYVSRCEIGAILSNEGTEEPNHPIAFISRTPRENINNGKRDVGIVMGNGIF